MKKLIVALGLGALMMGTSVFADSENSAWVRVDEGVCGMEIPGIGVIMGGDLHLVATKSGNTKYICKLTVPEEDTPEKVIKDSGFFCQIWNRNEDGLVINKKGTASKIIVTPGGEARFECSFNPNKPELIANP